MEKYEKMLTERDINVTAVRLLILKAMAEFPHTFSLSDLEGCLETVDKSTLFRTISLFHEKLLIHSIDDGTGSVKYSVCHNECECEVNDLHVHFYCTHCKYTVCLESIAIPKVNLPKGHTVEDVNFVIKGRCDKCNHSAT